MGEEFEVENLESIPSMLIYGDNRSGKTHLVGTNFEVEEFQPSYIIDCDKGAETIKKLNGKQKGYRFDKKTRMLSQMKEVITKAGDKKLVVIDTLSTLMADLLKELSGGAHPQFAHWNSLFNETLNFIKGLKEVCPFVIATAFPAYIENSEGQIIGVSPLMQGKNFPKYMMNEFNIIGFLSVKAIKDAKGPQAVYTLETRPNNFAIAGDRFGEVGTITDPTMKKIYERIVKVKCQDTTSISQ